MEILFLQGQTRLQRYLLFFTKRVIKYTTYIVIQVNTGTFNLKFSTFCVLQTSCCICSIITRSVVKMYVMYGV